MKTSAWICKTLVVCTLMFMSYELTAKHSFFGKNVVCVNVINPCTTTDTTFADSTYSGTATLTSKSILVAGTYYVNGTLTLNNCMVYVNAGGQIIVQSNGNLILNNTIVQSCDTMWRGINVLSKGKIKLNGSILRNADVGIYALDQSQVEILQSEIYDCVTGLKIPVHPGGGYNSIALKVDGSKFKMQSPNFKPDYAGQTPHGTLPKAGIDMTNMITTIGDANLNEFEKLNTGIVAISSIVTVKRSKFSNIGYDTFYNEPYRGTAIVSVGMPVGDIHTGDLTVLPEALNYNTVENCYRGIYTNKSKLTASFIHILNVRTGVEETSAPVLSTNTVSNCTITATHIGIKMATNPFARFMYATNNTITINGANGTGLSLANYGLWMSEFNQVTPVRYMASNNVLTLTNASHAIYAGALNTAKIKYNVVKLHGNGNGILVAANQNSAVSCNNITGNYATGITGNSNGISAGNMNNKVTMYCNTVDSTYRGFSFGGANPNTVFRGNEMNTHYVGLYLNTGSPTNPTYMGIQPHNGNKWNVPTVSGFGGMNLASNPFVPLSRFDVDSLLGSVYNPVVTPSSWFNPTKGGSTFYCSNSIVCSSQPPAMADTTIRELIASGIFDSEEISKESKAIAAEYLYKELAQDSTLWFSDSIYIQFMLVHKSDNTGNLYAADEYKKAAYTYDSTMMVLIENTYSQMKLFADSMNNIETWKVNHPTQDADSIYNHWKLTVEFLNQTVNNIKVQREAILQNRLDSAQYKNDLVVNGELPELNNKIINEIEIGYLERDEDVEIVRNNYIELYSIATQCPYTGGAAVERARTLIALINDSIDYDDANVCLQSGVYRLANNTTEKSEENGIKIIPNPASDKVKVELTGQEDGICKIQIRNVLNETVYESEFNCSEKTHLIHLNNLSGGIYSITVNAANKKSLTSKLILVK
ncbi:MAG: hypothetical protein HS118_11340 [Bacteroidia bacterium]|nr:hypothetical protein [Bacteroidia bacterium]